MNHLNSSFFKRLVKSVKNCLKWLRKTSKKNRQTFERFQLTFIYFFALIVLMYSIKTTLGVFPESIFSVFPFLAPLFEIQALKIFAAPEKIFIVYLLVLEFVVNRSYFNFSLLVKYNVLQIILLEMIQNLMYCYWDILFNRELDIMRIGVFAKYATMLFYSILFVLYFSLYIYGYVRSLQGFFPVFPGALKYVSDSVAFWLRIKVQDKGSKNAKDKKEQA